MKTMFAALTLLAAPGLAFAAPRIETVFGNTIVSTYPDGRMAYLWLRPDAQGHRLMYLVAQNQE